MANDSLATVYEWINNIHLYCVYANAALMLMYLILSQSRANEFDYIKRIRIFLPTYYSFLAATFFTGILLTALRAFVINSEIILMIIAIFLILYLALLQFKFFKDARRRRDYRKFKALSLLFLLIQGLCLILPTYLPRTFGF